MVLRNIETYILYSKPTQKIETTVKLDNTCACFETEAKNNNIEAYRLYRETDLNRHKND